MHLILDNYSHHKHHKVKAWREAHPRFLFHFIPTSFSWLNRVEAWFSALQRQVMDRGSFDDMADLQATLGRYVRGHNRQAMPPQWNVKADAILTRLAHIRQNLRNGALGKHQGIR